MTTEEPPKAAPPRPLLTANKAKKTRGPRKRVSESSIDRALRSGKLPHEVLLQASRTGRLPVVGANGKKRERAISSHQQLFAASAAAPFYAPKLSAIQVAPPPKLPEPGSLPELELLRRFAYTIAKAAHLEQRRREQREPLLLEHESTPVYREVDRRAAPAPAPAPEERPVQPDPLQALDEYRREQERIREENLHVSAAEMGWGDRKRPRVISGRRPLTGGGGE